MSSLLKLNLSHPSRRSRRGSVLILVIALVVLLALIGTAYLSSTQTQRYTSAQNTLNSETDILVKGVADTLTSNIVASVYGTSGNGNVPQYRPPNSEMLYYSATAGPTIPRHAGYTNYDSIVTDPTLVQTDPDPQDLFLASRVPTPFTNASYTNGVCWDSVSWPLLKDVTGGYTADSPLGPGQSLGPAVSKGLLTYVPSARPLADGSSAPNLTVIPSIYGRTLSGVTAPTGTVVAGDADGDGIADSFLCKVAGPINGITYYAATRVIDGNSAINASTAYSRDTDYLIDGTTNTTNFGFFRSNVGLAELQATKPTTGGTQPSYELNGLNNYRLGNVSSTTPIGPSSSPPAFTASPVKDPSGLAIPNFAWYSVGDILDGQLARRPGNPGIGLNGSTMTTCNWLGLNESAALAYHFTLPSASAQASIMEQIFPNELTGYLENRCLPYSPGQQGGTAANSIPNSASYTGYNWYGDLFYYLNNPQFSGTVVTQPAGEAPLRSVLTCSNPVSNAIPSWLGNVDSVGKPLAYSSGTVYNFGDWVTGPDNRSYVCLVPNPGSAPSATSATPYLPPVAVVSSPQAWVFEPFTQQAVKTSINTATFEQLWVAFAQVMTDSVGPDPLDYQSNVNTVGKQWQPPMQPFTTAAAAVNLASGKEPQMPMFRSTLRVNVAAGPSRNILTASQMLKLRAALAAINTIDLRGSSDDVSSRHIVLADSNNSLTSGHAYDVEVYGSKKEPYICELVLQVTGDPTTSYVAIELCNPYPTAIALTNWQITSSSRATPMSLTLSGLPIPAGTSVPAATATGQPGLLILEDGTPPADVNATITSSGLTPVPIPGLALATLGAVGQSANEIYVMRPRLASGTKSKSVAAQGDIYDENNDLADLVPVDQMDLTGLNDSVNGGKPVRFLYRRGTDISVNKNWHFVYPGGYDPTSVTARYKSSDGTSAILVDLTASTVPCNLGAYSGAGSIVAGTTPPANATTFVTAPLELNNVNMGGPNKLNSGTFKFPFGQFARQVDMLQIPFVGAYRIRSYGVPVVPNTAVEINSVTIDSALANDTTIPATAKESPSYFNSTTAYSSQSSANQSAVNEQIGRFCPIGDPYALATSASAMLSDPPHVDSANVPVPDPANLMDFGSGYLASDTTETKQYWHYHWARRLFDYLTVQSPQDDYYPNVEPTQGLLASPVPIANNDPTVTNAQVAGKSEDTAGVEGLININTAPAPVLAMLPFPISTTATPILTIDPGTGTLKTATQFDFAQAIVAYRNYYGPFQSVMDLNKVPLINYAQRQLLGTFAAGPAQGVFSPGVPTFADISAANPPQGPANAVRFDFQDRFWIVNRLSNLVTTRSDSFTCYVLVQGWRNAGSSSASLAVQRRAAFIIDRNGVTPSGRNYLNFKIPTE